MLTPKQEAFAQAVASGMSQADAYRHAFKVREGTKPESIQQAASRVMANVKVASRVDEIRAPAVKNARITLESHLADLQRLRDGAEAAGQYSAAIKAAELTGKVSGLYSEKIELTGKGGGPIEQRLDVSGLSTATLAELMKARDASNRS